MAYSRKPTPSPEYVERVKGMMPAGATLYTITRHTSKSGMLREISVFVVHEGDLEDVSYAAASILGYSINPDTNALRVSGVGMDMHFHVTSSLSYAIHNTAYAYTKRSL